MKIRQAYKICNNIHISNLVCLDGNPFKVVGVKNTPYNFRQFKKAYKVVKKSENKIFHINNET